jgi:predicted metal-binding membrane protein
MPVLALLISGLAWIALWATATTGGSGLYASSMSVGPTVGSAGVFLAAWEIMVLAMMLPSSIPFLACFRTVTAGGRFALAQRMSVCVGYALAWLWIGVVTALVGETLYRTTTVDVWLENHANLLVGVVLMLAGGFQFTALKRRCVYICSHPAMFIMRLYGRGVADALALGYRFGFICVGCCWALMASMVLLGGGSLALMMVLTVVMFAERVMGWNDRLVKLTGLAGVTLGVVIAASPDVAPALAQNMREWVGMQSTAMHLLMPGMEWCHG